MEEKESLKKESLQPPKLAGISQKLFNILKLLLGVLLLPFLYASTKSFIQELHLLERQTQIYFSSGTISFIIFYLFIWEAAAIYKRGQRLVEIIFRFFAPLLKLAPYVLPIYTIILFALYYLASLIYKSQNLINYFVFLMGFSIALHLVFSAKSLKSRGTDFLKANYIFGFSLVYAINIILFSFLLNLLFDKFSFVNFFNNSCQISANLFKVIFKQLFL